MSDLRIDIPTDRIASFCKKWRVTKLELFGSVLRDDFGPNSDVDVLACFEPNATPTFADLDDMESELSSVLQREVDLIRRSAVERSNNSIRRNSILDRAECIYDAA